VSPPPRTEPRRGRESAGLCRRGSPRRPSAQRPTEVMSGAVTPTVNEGPPPHATVPPAPCQPIGASEPNRTARRMVGATSAPRPAANSVASSGRTSAGDAVAGHDRAA
jgi:hypothetical protein